MRDIGFKASNSADKLKKHFSIDTEPVLSDAWVTSVEEDGQLVQGDLILTSRCLYFIGKSNKGILLVDDALEEILRSDSQQKRLSLTLNNKECRTYVAGDLHPEKFKHLVLCLEEKLPQLPGSKVKISGGQEGSTYNPVLEPPLGSQGFPSGFYPSSPSAPPGNYGFPPISGYPPPPVGGYPPPPMGGYPPPPMNGYPPPVSGYPPPPMGGYPPSGAYLPPPGPQLPTQQGTPSSDSTSSASSSAAPPQYNQLYTQK
eukprot:TRINITY_DN376_c0_g1_i2.p1 TRINITY_DN376_c0_g1~~TRINITY_DN376_c0_g1_i2.p1  ORF type:complete len:283 (-),score=57.58 TRINITY_DN376_c0_g1_i2:260-1030(-)